MPAFSRQLAGVVAGLTLGVVAIACHDVMTPEVRGVSHAPALDAGGAASRIVVTPDSMRGWVFVDDQRSVACTDTTVCALTDGPARPTLGSGSAMLATSTADDGNALVLQGYNGVRLDQVTELRYATYRESADPGNNLAVALQLTVDFDLSDASAAWQGRLVFEPYHANSGQVTQGTWQSWDAKSGRWWGTRSTVVVGGMSTSNPCVQSSPCTWAELMATFPNAGIHPTYGSVILKAGSGWIGFRGNVDSLSIGVAGVSTVYDFEKTGSPSVPSLPPDSVPVWVHSDSNIVDGGDVIAGPLAKRVIVLAFEPGTSDSDRASAVASIGGTVIGGVPTDTAEGFYYVGLPQDTAPSQIMAAAQTVASSPGVVLAVPDLLAAAEDDYRRPTDGPGAIDWQVDPNAADGDNWALERIGAPLAWGCSTGDASVRVAVIDAGFHDVDDLRPNVQGTVRYSAPTPGSGHGTSVASIIAARGDNHIGMTGVMWSANLRLYERADTPDEQRRGLTALTTDMARMTSAIREGARIINISGHIGNYHADAAGRAAVEVQRQHLQRILRLRASDPHAPLFILSAGNAAQDAYYNGYPAIALDFPSRVLVVAAGAQSGGGLEQSSNSGMIVKIAAPGEHLQAINEAGTVTANFHRTSGATPYVAGVAGLLMAFDPTLTTSEVRDLVVAGAIVGGRTAGGIPLLNAYESLRLAARRPGAPLCGNRIWVNDGGVPQVMRGSASEPLASSATGELGDYLYVPHGGRQVMYSTRTAEGFFEWGATSHSWAASTQDFWNQPDSVTDNLYGRTRAAGWNHDRLLMVEPENNGPGVGVWIRDTARFTPHRWAIGVIPSQGTSSGVVYAIRHELAEVPVCVWYGNDPCGDQRPGAADVPYPDSLTTFDTLSATTDYSYGQAAFAMAGDSVFITHVPVIGTLTWTDWHPCPENPGFVDGYAYFTCREPVYSYTFGAPTIQTLPASPEATANSTTSSHNFNVDASVFSGGRRPLWITTDEAGEEIVVAEGVPAGSTPFGVTFSDCRIHWIARRTGVVNHTEQSAHACVSRGVGTVAPVAGYGNRPPTTPSTAPNSAPNH